MSKSFAPDFSNITVEEVILPYRQEPYSKFSFGDPKLEAISLFTIEDSLSVNGSRLTTFTARYPRYVHSELLTHRLFSKNSSSSRARSVQSTIGEVMENPVIPLFTINKAGMSGEYSPEHIRLKQIDAWLLARDKAVASALSLLIGPEVLANRTDSEVARDYKELTEHYYSNVYDKTGEVIRGLSTHKQVVNRLLEPWLLIEIVLTSSYWNNFLKLRNHGGAQPEIHALAALVDLALESSQPEPRLVHLPFIESSSRPSPQSSWAEVWETSLLSSTECAQISYRDKTAQTESTASLALAHRLLDSGHYSPFEHVAFTRDEYVRLTMRNKDLERRLENLVSNFDPAWIQFRQVLSGRTL